MHFKITNTLTKRNIIIILIIIIIVGGIYLINWTTVNTYTANIIKINKLRETHQTKTSSGKIRRKTTSKVLIHTDKGIFEDSSDLLRRKIGSQYYHSLHEDETYVLTVSGINLNFLRIYPNIIDVKEVITTTTPNTTPQN